MYKVKIANIKEFQESKETWDQLAAAMRFPSIFCEWEWIFTWWERFGKEHKLCILFVYKQTELVAILPLYSHKIIDNGWGIGCALSYCGSMDVYPDHLDIICSEKEAEQCINAISDFLLLEYTGWDALYLSHLPEDAHLISWFNRNDFPFDFEIQKAAVAPFISLSGTFDEYLTRTFDGKERYNLRKKRKRLYEQHGIRYQAYDTLQGSQGLKTLFDLHELRAKRKNIVSTFKGSDIFRFHYALLQRINENDRLWFRFLRNEKEIIAAFYGFASGGRLFYYQMGFDPAWEQYSPGMILFYEVIKEAFSKNYIEFDFLRGDEEYKKKWTGERRTLFTCQVYNKTVRGALIRTTSRSKNLIKRNLKKLMGY